MDAPGLIPPLIGAPLSPRSGGVAGIVEDLLVDEASHRPVWLLVRLHDVVQPYTFVPAERMASRTGSVVVPFDEKALRETAERGILAQEPTQVNLETSMEDGQGRCERRARVFRRSRQNRVPLGLRGHVSG
jgi:hypothetical protein